MGANRAQFVKSYSRTGLYAAKKANARGESASLKITEAWGIYIAVHECGIFVIRDVVKTAPYRPGESEQVETFFQMQVQSKIRGEAARIRWLTRLQSVQDGEWEPTT